jgi:hypothetical protein
MKQSIKLDIPEDQMLQAAVGRIAIRHGQLDHVLRMTIKTFRGITIKAAMTETRRWGSSRLRECIEELAKEKLGQHESAALKELKRLLKKAEGLTEKRNRTIHDVWARTKDGMPVIRDDNSAIRIQPTTAVLDNLANEIARVAYDLNEGRLRGFLGDALARLAN